MQALCFVWFVYAYEANKGFENSEVAFEKNCIHGKSIPQICKYMLYYFIFSG